MSAALIGWGLAAVAVAVGYIGYGWRGVVLAFTLIVFWLLLQFSRTLRALRKASSAPVGSVASAVMLHSRLREGMTLMQVLPLTRSLGERITPPLGSAEESWRWRDAGDASVVVSLRGGRICGWALQRGAATTHDVVST
jgi:hypothetical protein